MPQRLQPQIKNSNGIGLNRFYPDKIIPTEGEINGIFTNENIRGTWETNITPFQGDFNVVRSQSDRPSSYPCTTLSWDEYKKNIQSKKGKDFIYRGQSNPWKLRTTFHRNHRTNLTRYMTEDIPTLHRHVSSLPGMFYNLNDPIQYGAFINLLQHHGYPTPLLDWTLSPYIASYFAFKEVDTTQPGGHIRIYILNRKNWQRYTDQAYFIGSPILTLTTQELLPIHNNRVIPQSSITTFSTVDDIESFILEKETSGEKYLEIIEIPYSEKNNVMEDLYQMGITESSLFPGIDGICRAFKELNFPHK